MKDYILVMPFQAIYPNDLNGEWTCIFRLVLDWRIEPVGEEGLEPFLSALRRQTKFSIVFLPHYF